MDAHLLVPSHTYLDFLPYYRILVILCAVMLLIELMHIWGSGRDGPGVDLR